MPDPSPSDIVSSFSEPAAPLGEPAPDPAASQTTYAPAEPRRRYISEWDPRSAPGTYFLLAVNIAVFLWMLLNGVSISSPTLDQLLHFGANNATLVLEGQWWRLITAIFVHIGLLHIATNMWCL